MSFGLSLASEILSCSIPVEALPNPPHVRNHRPVGKLLCFIYIDFVWAKLCFLFILALFCSCLWVVCSCPVMRYVVSVARWVCCCLCPCPCLHFNPWCPSSAEFLSPVRSLNIFSFSDSRVSSRLSTNTIVSVGWRPPSVGNQNYAKNGAPKESERDIISAKPLGNGNICKSCDKWRRWSGKNLERSGKTRRSFLFAQGPTEQLAFQWPDKENCLRVERYAKNCRRSHSKFEKINWILVSYVNVEQRKIISELLRHGRTTVETFDANAFV